MLLEGAHVKHNLNTEALGISCLILAEGVMYR